jgi:hypothetical protein
LKPQRLLHLSPQAASLALSLVVDQQERFLALQSHHNLLLDHLQAVLQGECLHQVCHQLECHLVVQVQVQVLVLFHLLPDQCLLLVDRYLRLLVAVLLLAVLVLVGLVDSVLVLEHVLALVLVLVLAALVPVAQVALVLAVLVALVPVAQVAQVLVLVLLLVPVALAVLVALDLAVLAPVVLAQAALVAALVLVAVLAAHVMVNVAHLARSRVLVVGASSMNCSRSSRTTQTAMLQFLKAPSLLNVVSLHKSSLRN